MTARQNTPPVSVAAKRPYTTNKEHMASIEDRVTMIVQQYEGVADQMTSLMARLQTVEKNQGELQNQFTALGNKVDASTTVSQQNHDLLMPMHTLMLSMADTMNGNKELGRKGLYQEIVDIKNDVSSLKVARATAAALVSVITAGLVLVKDKIIAALHL